MKKPICIGCNRTPANIPGYAIAEDMEADGYDDADDYARDDGTFNDENGHFWCNGCYISAGMPLGVAP